MEIIESSSSVVAEEEPKQEQSDKKTDKAIVSLTPDEFVRLTQETYINDKDVCLEYLGRAVVNSGLFTGVDDLQLVGILQEIKAITGIGITALKKDFTDAFATAALDGEQVVEVLPEPPTEAELLAQCEHIAKDPLNSLTKAITNLGLKGEIKNGVFVYLAAVSSWQKKPIRAAIKGSSSSGKSFTTSTALSLMPDSVVFNCSSMSAKALIYKGEDFFQHKLIYLAEGEALVTTKGQKNEVAEMLRVLISEGVLKHTATEMKPYGSGYISVDHICKGPIGFMTTTTRKVLETELETRLISIYANESGKQTRDIVDAISKEATGHQKDDVNFEEWFAFAEWVRRGPQEVVIPYMSIIGKSMSSSNTRARRDISSLISVIKASALMNRYNRQLNPEGDIIAEPYDYKVAYATVGAAMEEAVNESLSDTTLQQLQALIKQFPTNRSRLHTSVLKISNTNKEIFGTNKPCKVKLMKLEEEGLIKIHKASNGIDIELDVDTQDRMKSTTGLISYEELVEKLK